MDRAYYGTYGFKWPGFGVICVFVFGKYAGFITWPWWVGLISLIFILPYKKEAEHDSASDR